MNIEPNKLYKTRNGKQARIYVTDGAAPYPVHGAVKYKEGWKFLTWMIGGETYGSGADSENDLIAEWIDKPEYDWRAIPPSHKWAAIDVGGSVYSHSEKPKCGNFGWSSTGEICRIHPDFEPKWPGDWRNSLVERP